MKNVAGSEYEEGVDMPVGQEGMMCNWVSTVRNLTQFSDRVSVS